MGLLCAFILCIVALILLLPHSSSSGGMGGGQPITPANGTENIINPATTIGPSTTAPSVNTTTITSSSPNQSTNTAIFNYSNYVQQLINPNNQPTTTILYVYCVGNPTPPFTQSYYSQLDQSGAESWKATTSYPIPFLDGSCASTGGTVYCVGDSSIIFGNHTRQAYYSSLSSSGIGPWTQTTSYPVPFSSGSCSAYNGYVYCVGTANQSNSRDTFYAPVSASGIGPWTQTTSYPVPFSSGSCSAYNGYVYCVGDAYSNATAIENYIKSLNTANIHANGGLPPLNITYDNGYYATISASGVGQWKRITAMPLPINGGSCTISNATIYCVGGSSAALASEALAENYTSLSAYGNYTSLISQIFSNETSVAIYAPIEPDGSVGNWTYTAPYPTKLQSAQCTSNGSNIYCIGGMDGPQSVFYSALSQTLGIEGWLQTTDYPVPFYSGYCSTNSKA